MSKALIGPNDNFTQSIFGSLCNSSVIVLDLRVLTMTSEKMVHQLYIVFKRGVINQKLSAFRHTFTLFVFLFIHTWCRRFRMLDGREIRNMGDFMCLVGEGEIVFRQETPCKWGRLDSPVKYRVTLCNLYFFFLTKTDHIQESDTWTLPLPEPSNASSLRLSFRTQKAAIYARFDSYDFTNDSRYQAGVQQIIKQLLSEGCGHNSNRQDLELQAKLFYFSRYDNII